MSPRCLCCFYCISTWLCNTTRFWNSVLSPLTLFKLIYVCVCVYDESFWVFFYSHKLREFRTKYDAYLFRSPLGSIGKSEQNYNIIQEKNSRKKKLLLKWKHSIWEVDDTTSLITCIMPLPPNPKHWIIIIQCTKQNYVRCSKR